MDDELDFGEDDLDLATRQSVVAEADFDADEDAISFGRASPSPGPRDEAEQEPQTEVAFREFGQSQEDDKAMQASSIALDVPEAQKSTTSSPAVEQERPRNSGPRFASQASSRLAKSSASSTNVRPTQQPQPEQAPTSQTFKPARSASAHDPSLDEYGNTLPLNWVSKISRSSLDGKMYYRHTVSNRTTWDLPTSSDPPCSPPLTASSVPQQPKTDSDSSSRQVHALQPADPLQEPTRPTSWKESRRKRDEPTLVGEKPQGRADDCHNTTSVRDTDRRGDEVGRRNGTVRREDNYRRSNQPTHDDMSHRQDEPTLAPELAHSTAQEASGTPTRAPFVHPDRLKLAGVVHQTTDQRGWPGIPRPTDSDGPPPAKHEKEDRLSRRDGLKPATSANNVPIAPKRILTAVSPTIDSATTLSSRSEESWQKQDSRSAPRSREAEREQLKVPITAKSTARSKDDGSKHKASVTGTNQAPLLGNRWAATTVSSLTRPEPTRQMPREDRDEVQTSTSGQRHDASDTGYNDDKEETDFLVQTARKTNFVHPSRRQMTVDGVEAVLIPSGSRRHEREFASSTQSISTPSAIARNEKKNNDAAADAYAARAARSARRDMSPPRKKALLARSPVLASSATRALPQEAVNDRRDVQRDLPPHLRHEAGHSSRNTTEDTRQAIAQRDPPPHLQHGQAAAPSVFTDGSKPRREGESAPAAREASELADSSARPKLNGLDRRRLSKSPPLAPSPFQKQRWRADAERARLAGLPPPPPLVGGYRSRSPPPPLPRPRTPPRHVDNGWARAPIRRGRSRSPPPPQLSTRAAYPPMRPSSPSGHRDYPPRPLSPSYGAYRSVSPPPGAYPRRIGSPPPAIADDRARIQQRSAYSGGYRQDVPHQGRRRRDDHVTRRDIDRPAAPESKRATSPVQEKKSTVPLIHPSRHLPSLPSPPSQPPMRLENAGRTQDRVGTPVRDDPSVARDQNDVDHSETRDTIRRDKERPAPSLLSRFNEEPSVGSKSNISLAGRFDVASRTRSQEQVNGRDASTKRSRDGDVYASMPPRGNKYARR
ncbi:hypothetical protein OIO90_001716 [Microbotryomycetes sp. JL221]|nr:hypothetical protein OIO90_001716 [Microbotryomycetes sp. JL221]